VIGAADSSADRVRCRRDRAGCSIPQSIAFEAACLSWCPVARYVLKYDERKLTLLALSHGITEVEAEEAFDRSGRRCPAQTKKALEAEAAQKFNRRP
jgi:hypothetical protein